MKPKLCYELEYYDTCLPPSWELRKRFPATQEKSARKEFESWSKHRPGEFRLYEVTRKKLKPRK